MNKTTLFIAVFAMVICGMTPVGAVVRRKHQPWFSGSKAAPVKADEPAVKEAASQSPAKAAKVTSAPKPVAKKVATENSSNEPGRQIVRKAMDYKGTRYRYGGTTKKGLDCSGLVNRVWEDLKMNKIPRASSALFNTGKPIRLAELRPGDLVFFKNTYKRGISHVGVYAGNNKFVHASYKHGVTTAKLSDPYYQLHYAGARRLY